MPDQSNENLVRFLRLLVATLEREYNLKSKAIHLLPVVDGTHSHVFIYPAEGSQLSFDHIHEAEIFINKLISNFYFKDISNQIALQGYQVKSYNIAPVRQSPDRKGMTPGLVTFEHNLGSEEEFNQTFLSFYPHPDLAEFAYARFAEPFSSISEVLFIPEYKLIKNLLLDETDKVLNKKETSKPRLKSIITVLKKNYLIIIFIVVVLSLIAIAIY